MNSFDLDVFGGRVVPGPAPDEVERLGYLILPSGPDEMEEIRIYRRRRNGALLVDHWYWGMGGPSTSEEMDSISAEVWQAPSPEELRDFMVAQMRDYESNCEVYQDLADRINPILDRLGMRRVPRHPERRRVRVRVGEREEVIFASPQQVSMLRMLERWGAVSIA